MEQKKIPVIHQTDCFHPHNDPDDHWDLACQFALAYAEEIELKGILLDASPEGLGYGDPALCAVGQMNHITGLSVPAAVGSSEKLYTDAHIEKVAAQKPLNSGVNMLFRLLEEAEEKVAIHIVGSARDVAAAAMLRPELFRQKCRGVYLNAGSAVENTLEYNVALDPYSYSKMFSLPCPLYWLPCFHEVGEGWAFYKGAHGSWWQFEQGKVLGRLSENVQKFFAYALSKSEEPHWLRYLSAPLDEKTIAGQSSLVRNMWCTAGFLHAAGQTVTVDGEIVPEGQPGAAPVFAFEPIEATCDAGGHVRWQKSDAGRQFIFTVLAPEKYEYAMMRAMEALLARLP